MALGFFTAHASSGTIDAPYRRLHLDAYLDPAALKNNKQRLKFMRRTCASLLDEAADDLRTSKSIHDQIESYYNPYIDFDGLYKLADELGNKMQNQYCPR